MIFDAPKRVHSHWGHKLLGFVEAKKGNTAAAVAAEYLKKCETFWPNESMRRWISDVEQQQMPTFERNRDEE